MTKIRFNIPNFMTGTLPSDGSTIKEDLTIVGTDGTTVIVKSNPNTIYHEKPTKHFEATVNDDKWVFKFIFPKKTLTNSNSTQYTTPSKSVYLFASREGASYDKEIVKLISYGKIEIIPPKDAMMKSLLDNTINTIDTTKNQATTFVNNATLLESSLSGEMSKIKLLKDSPFNAMGIIVYKLLMDMLVILIFWALFISISCWLKVPSELIYPTDVTKYPFIFYDKPKPNEDTYYDPTVAGDDGLCKPVSIHSVPKNRADQDKFFESLDKLDDDIKAILKVVYPAFMKKDGSGVPALSSMLYAKCFKTELCTTDYITYFVNLIVFYNYLYCGSALAMLHTGFGYLSNKVIGALSKQITIIAFALLLYYMYLGVGSMNNVVMEKIKMKLDEEKDMKSMLMNQMKKLIVSIISCCLSVILPLTSILVITSLLGTAYTLGKSCLFPMNTTVAVIAFLTFFFSVSQYVFIAKSLSKGMNAFDLIEQMYKKDFSIRTLFSFLGITIPILIGLSYGTYIGFNLFFSFFQLLNEPSVTEILKNTSTSVVLVGLMFLILHVKEVLGHTYSVMTFIIILLVGLYVMFKK